jgi:hypothetical protein
MNKKFIIVLIVLIGVIFAAAYSYVMFFRTPSNIAPDQNIINNQASNNSGTTTDETIKKIKARSEADNINNAGTQPVIAQDKSVKKDDLKRMAGLFAERFGSYSNQSDYSNINDLKIFMSRKMCVWADNYVTEQKKSGLTAIYYGITTKSVSEEVKNFDEDSGLAVILVSTRRREANGTTNNVSNIFNQNILINFIKENGIWKVDSASWQM